MGRLDGKVALVTGGARGMGRAQAVALAREGAAVAITDIVDQIATVPYGLAQQEDLDQTVSLVEAVGGRGRAMLADVRSQQQMDEAVAQTIATFGSLDITVANAGILTIARLHEITDEIWDDVMDVNAKGVWHTIKAVVPHMVERRDGSIVVIASINGLEGSPANVHYVASKHAAVGITRTAAIEYGRHGIRVNAICPGFVDTPMTDWSGMYELTSRTAGATREEHLRSGHYGHALAGRGALTPEAVAEAVLWLASPEAKDVTGVALPVDAGHMILPGANDDPVFAEDLGPH
jgi:SDR family mycofactocin-dependent oxidoreductase